MKYYDYAVVFAEVPDEITLALDIVNCPHKCKNCHSPWLRENKGELITKEEIQRLIEKNPGITCICFMGGDANHEEVVDLSRWIHQTTKLKVAMYSGDDEIDQRLLNELDYYKIGSYIEEKGPLNNPNTNQVMLKRTSGHSINITYRFQQKIEL